MSGFVDNSRQFIDELHRKEESVLTAVGIFLMGEAQDELENSPRRVDTGNLKNSIGQKYVGSEKAVYIGTNVDYGIYVHEGTVNMTPNRFLKNAVENNRDQIKKYIEDGMK